MSLRWWKRKGERKMRRPERRSGSGRRLCFESLEAKLPMAGNVVSAFAAGNLTLTGDAAGNAIYLMGAGAGNVQVWGSGTTIDGTPFKLFTGVTNLTFVDQGGSDSIAGFGLTLPGNLTLATDPVASAGNDVISLSSINLGGDLVIHADPQGGLGAFVNSSAGADVVTLSQIAVQDDAIIMLGGTGGLAGVRSDAVSIVGLTANNFNTTDGTSIVATGVGRDRISASSMTINSTIEIVSDADQGGTGLSQSDAVALANIQAAGELAVLTDGLNLGVGTGRDAVSMVNVQTGNLTLWTGGGSDVVSIDRSSFGVAPLGNIAGANDINVGGLGSDRDSVTILRSTFFGGVGLLTGNDADYVYVAYSTFVGPVGAGIHTGADLGPGNDIIYVVSNTFDSAANVFLFGGTGFDYFYGWLNKTTLGAPIVFPNPGDIEVFFSF